MVGGAGEDWDRSERVGLTLLEGVDRLSRGADLDCRSEYQVAGVHLVSIEEVFVSLVVILVDVADINSSVGASRPWHFG